ncbi:MAG: UbiA prenyltransferase family protein [Bacteroidales bacterium]|jgi:geranylgeranylglycerol-phosphate geranylgeranyltransferase|nr:UbiA prenyltransferase family protein [Bacteroidales bacterium]
MVAELIQRVPLLVFLKAYIKSMRLYYSFVTGIAGWIGVSFYQFVAHSSGPRGTSNIAKTIEIPTPPEKMLVILVLLFLAWGINQIINDYLGRKEDRINAPERPMVSGKLDPGRALALSISLLALSFMVTWIFLQPIAVIPLAAGVLLNVLYEYAKGYGIWGNIVFGLMISMCGLFGFYASGPMEIWMTKSRFSALFFIAVMNGLMTYYTYFKDFTGDLAAGKKTIIVTFGIEKNRYISIAASFLPSILFIIGYYAFGSFEIKLNNTFVILGILTVFLQIWTGYLYYKNPKGEMTYYSLVTNFRACTCGQTTIIALFNPTLGMVLFLVSYVFVGFLFNLHTNIKA